MGVSGSIFLKKGGGSFTCGRGEWRFRQRGGASLFLFKGGEEGEMDLVYLIAGVVSHPQGGGRNGGSFSAPNGGED